MRCHHIGDERALGRITTLLSLPGTARYVHTVSPALITHTSPFAPKWFPICIIMSQNTHIVKISILLKTIYRISEIAIKIPAGFFVETVKLTLKFAQQYNETRRAFSR